MASSSTKTKTYSIVYFKDAGIGTMTVVAPNKEKAQSYLLNDETALSVRRVHTEQVAK